MTTRQSVTKRVPTGLVPAIALDGGGPIYQQLAEWFRRAIAEGRLRPGQRVPSTRALAGELGVSRLPVLGAYEQLHAEGYLESFTGAGTCVAAAIPHEGAGAPQRRATRARHPRPRPRRRAGSPRAWRRWPCRRRAGWKARARSAWAYPRSITFRTACGRAC
jgi:Predicted transcriptional regulators